MNHTVYERDKDNIMKWQKENTTTVNIRIKHEEKALWQEYADYAGKPLATLIRELMAQYIADVEQGYEDYE